MSPLKRIVDEIQRVRTARRVGALGKWSKIIRPELLHNEKNVFLGERVYIHPHARVECLERQGRFGQIRIGDGTKIQLYFHCASADSVTIGAGVLVAGRVYITDHDHVWPANGPTDELVTAPVVIGDRCWLGQGCAILKGVTLGHDCVVGTNAVVTRSAPPYSMLAGMPARVIKKYDPQRRAWAPVRSTSGGESSQAERVNLEREAARRGAE